MKRVLVLGASGLIMPHVTPGLEAYYDLRITDVKPHPTGRPVEQVDVTDYGRVYEAMTGMDAVINATVVRNHAKLSFDVNVLGAYHVMKAAAAHGIRKIIHTGPQLYRRVYDEDFDIVDAALQPDSGYYGLTKHLSYEICRIYARTFDIQTVCFVFNGLGAKPDGPKKEDFPPMVIVWEDLQQACRLALEVDRIPDGFQVFHMHSHEGHGKYLLDHAKRILGWTPQPWTSYYRRGES
ncbi:MAG: NAD-dependent epimerase/dehydratase family protein [candidate division Zixibacteria bacterium]|nr:NAD-dependent epimerase/dehydratase family protein [candidate division Zixibacteria bacterium]